jgi:AcrR family transcriptional regulator
MGIAERREREREQVRTRVVEAARDLLSEQGLGGLSMRGIAERIEYSPGTIYLYFRDKDELIREVVHAGFERMAEYVEVEVAALGEAAADPLQRFRAMGRAYVRFALENTAYFRVMFELPSVPHMDCPATDVHGAGRSDAGGFDNVIATLDEAASAGVLGSLKAQDAAIIGWGMVHGLTSLYLAGHLAELVPSNEAFQEVAEQAMASLYTGWSSAG